MEDLKLPSDWEKVFGVIILDPDGWRGDLAKDWNDPISRQEFMQRAFMSTIDSSQMEDAWFEHE